ncbi:MAG: hypothetical protein QOJ65_215, partial [Fimbriimonadaceae bacterium]|nr:hypothetical protein [Fimbriimonadaceae bacterium]
GVPEKDTTTFQTKGGIRPDTHADQGTIGTINEAVTSGGGIAIDGGKLAGNRDDFEGDLGQRGPRPAGANPNNRVTPAHDLPTGDSGKTADPD